MTTTNPAAPGSAARAQDEPDAGLVEKLSAAAHDAWMRAKREQGVTSRDSSCPCHGPAAQQAPEGDSPDDPPADVLRAAQAAIAGHRWHGITFPDGGEYAAICSCGWEGPPRWRGHVVVEDYGRHVAALVIETAWPHLAGRALRDYADRHHAHPGGPLDLAREAYSLYGERYLACRACDPERLDEAGACTRERPRLLRAADRIARGEPDPADPPRPGTEYVPETIVREVDRG